MHTTGDNDSKLFKASLKINLESAFQAEVMKSVLEVDEELQPNRLSRTITAENNQLIV